MRRRMWFVLVGVAVLLLAVLAWSLMSSRVSSAYRTEAVAKGDVVQTVAANGALMPVTVVKVGAQISGRIKALHADFNDRVEADQVLAELDDASLKAQLAQSEAQLASARAQLALAQANADRARDLASRGANAKAQLQEAEANLGIARSAVGVAEARVAVDRVNLGYGVIRSPVAGVVMSRDVDVGQTVAASLSAPQIFQIAQDLAKMQINTTVAEADVGLIKPGMAATFRVDAFPGRMFKSTVRQVRLNPTTESNVVSYNVVQDVSNDDLTLLPGMTSYVNIVISEAHDVLRVPNAALRFRPGSDGAGRAQNAGRGERSVFVLDGGTLKPVKVTTGITDGKFTVVTGGELNEGDLVVTGLAAAGAQPTGPASPMQRRGAPF